MLRIVGHLAPAESDRAPSRGDGELIPESVGLEAVGEPVMTPAVDFADELPFGPREVDPPAGWSVTVLPRSASCRVAVGSPAPSHNAMNRRSSSDSGAT